MSYPFHTHPRRGAMLVSMMMSLIIIFILMAMYFAPVGGWGGTSAVPWQITQLEKTRDTVCIANRRTYQQNAIMAQMDGGGAAALQRAAQGTGPCPGSGRYYIDGHDVYCTQHSETPLFADLL